MRELRTRTVVLLGRRPPVTWDSLRTALGKGDDLVVLSLGYPVTAAQRTWLLAAQDLAGEIGAWFDAVLVTSTNEILATLQPDDEVHVAARGLERRRLRGTLAPFRY